MPKLAKNHSNISINSDRHRRSMVKKGVNDQEKVGILATTNHQKVGKRLDSFILNKDLMAEESFESNYGNLHDSTHPSQIKGKNYNKQSENSHSVAHNNRPSMVESRVELLDKTIIIHGNDSERGEYP